MHTLLQGSSVRFLSLNNKSVADTTLQCAGLQIWLELLSEAVSYTQKKEHLNILSIQKFNFVCTCLRK